MAQVTSHHTLPPFPDDVKAAPLVSISYADLESGDASTSTALFEAAKGLGFFYLDFLDSELGRTIVQEAEQLNAVQKEFFALPNEVKDVYGRPHLDPFYAYRYNETPYEDADGKKLRGFQNYNVIMLARRDASLIASSFAKTISLGFDLDWPAMN